MMNAWYQGQPRNSKLCRDISIKDVVSLQLGTKEEREAREKAQASTCARFVHKPAPQSTHRLHLAHVSSRLSYAEAQVLCFREPFGSGWCSICPLYETALRSQAWQSLSALTTIVAHQLVTTGFQRLIILSLRKLTRAAVDAGSSKKALQTGPAQLGSRRYDDDGRYRKSAASCSTMRSNSHVRVRCATTSRELLAQPGHATVLSWPAVLERYRFIGAAYSRLISPCDAA